MCMSAILWAGFREYIYGTTIERLVEMKWEQILLSSEEVARKSWPLSRKMRIIGRVGTEVTDPLFAWQYQPEEPCPIGCSRSENTGSRMATCHQDIRVN